MNEDVDDVANFLYDSATVSDLAGIVAGLAVAMPEVADASRPGRRACPLCGHDTILSELPLRHARDCPWVAARRLAGLS